jgi:hypothetical protein
LNYLKSYELTRTIHKKFRHCSRRTFDHYRDRLLFLLESCLDEVSILSFSRPTALFCFFTPHVYFRFLYVLTIADSCPRPLF